MESVAPDWLADDERVAHHRFEPARPGSAVDWPAWLPPDIVASLRQAGIQAPWAHQVEAAEHAFAGRHVTIGTGTASGKSLAYLMPVLAATAAAEPRLGVAVDSLRSKLAPRRPHTALYLSPTKALAHDQLRAARRLAPSDWNAIALDGDANQAERRFAKDWAHLVLTNPDMLHLSVLPNHRRWGALLGSLRYVVIDEAHRYRGVFGTHVAQVVRRLRRICQFHGADPTFVLASATAADPGRTGSALIGDQVETVTVDQAPHPARSVVLLRPERDTNTEATDLLARLVGQGRQTLAFVGSRVQSELVAQHAQERLGDAAARVASYRSGYLAEDRRSIEAELQSGALSGVAATSALELGIDVAGMDAVVIAGFPGTRAAFWQRAGRAGRGDRDALVIGVARDDPLDQYLWSHPELLLGADPDAVVLNPENPHVLGPHVLAAAQELPLTLDDERWFGSQVGAITRAAEARGWLRSRPHHGGQAWFWARADRAVDGISLRSMGSGPVRVVEPESGQVIGEVDQASADRMVHTGAIHLHMGEQWLIEDYRPEEQQALAKRVHVPYFTQSQSTSEVSILTDVGDAPFGVNDVAVPGQDAGVRVHQGRVRIREQVVGYLRRDTESLQVWDSTPLDLPPRDLVTQSMWWTIPEAVLEVAGLEGPAVGAAAHGLEHTAIGLLPAFATCDRWDIGGLSTAVHAQTGLCTIFVHDGHPGGAGFAEAGYGRASQWLLATVERLERCACQTGCPACVVSPKCGNANQMLDKDGALRLGRAMLGLPVGDGVDDRVTGHEPDPLVQRRAALTTVFEVASALPDRRPR